VADAARVLLFARHYPPAVSGGARRPYLLARGLRALGCDVFVVAPDPPPDGPGLGAPHPHRDPAPATDVAPKPKSLRDLARDWLLWPDPDIRWTRRATAAALAALPFEPTLVITTSPPESIHWAGAALKRRTGCAWIADLRDEWLARPFRAARRWPLRAAMERRLARRLLARTDLITCVDDVVEREARALAPGVRVAVISQFADPPPAPEPLEGDGRHVLHTGSFSLSDPGCRIEPVLDAFARALAESSDLRLDLVGRLTNAEREAVEACPARARIAIHGPQPYARTRALQAAADGFIVTAAPDSTAVPSKVYEYRAAGGPIVAVGDGPWRARGGYPVGDPVALLRNLPPRAPGAAPENPPWTSEDAARRLLALLAEARSAHGETLRNDV
jgi:glycosyltransferase involved in cell wall biosynthesis